MPVILILEDEPLIALDLAMTLEARTGIEVVLVMTLEQMSSIDLSKVGVAVLDVNIGCKTSYAFARDLLAIDVPVIFATGSRRADIPEDLRSIPFLSKPCSQSTIVQLVSAALDMPQLGRASS